MPSADKDASRPLVALVCANAYPLFDSGVCPVGGGMEARAALFGRGLAAGTRWHVNFVVSDFGQPFVTRHEGIDFRIYHPTYRRAGRNVFPRLRKRRLFPILNFDRSDLDLVWQIPLIAAWLAMPALFFPRFWRRLKPTVACCFGNSAQTAEVIADCRRSGIPTMLCVASDKDLSPDYRPGNRELNHYGMAKWKGYYSLTSADSIVVQTETQREVLRRNFGREATLIRNPVHVSPDDPQHWPPRGQREFVLWIGRADDYNKRPMLFLKLARDCPGMEFVMIVIRTDELAFQTLLGARPKNLLIVEYVPAHEIRDYLRRARVFVNTSQFEGFPNTFLESAVMGVPIVSLAVDPDDMLTSGGCGICVGDDLDALRASVQELYFDVCRAEDLAGKCHRYVLDRHEGGQRIAEFEACLDEQWSVQTGVISSWHKWRRFVRVPLVQSTQDAD